MNDSVPTHSIKKQNNCLSQQRVLLPSTGEFGTQLNKGADLIKNTRVVSQMTHYIYAHSNAMYSSHVTYGISHVASPPFINALPWPNRIVKCPAKAHFRISPEVVHHPGTFHLLCIRTYYFVAVSPHTI